MACIRVKLSAVAGVIATWKAPVIAVLTVRPWQLWSAGKWCYTGGPWRRDVGTDIPVRWLLCPIENWRRLIWRHLVDHCAVIVGVSTQGYVRLKNNELTISPLAAPWNYRSSKNDRSFKSWNSASWIYRSISPSFQLLSRCITSFLLHPFTVALVLCQSQCFVCLYGIPACWKFWVMALKR